MDDTKGKAHHGHKWMPVMYAIFFGLFKAQAEKCGYALAIHGSFTRDMDLILVPWVDNPSPVIDVLRMWAETVGDIERPSGLPYTSIGIKPHGRVAYTIPVGGGGYVDVSVIHPKNDPPPTQTVKE